MNSEIKDIICERILCYKGTKSISVSIGRPTLKECYPNEFVCSYIIRGIGSESVRIATGVDGFHALMLALTMIGTDLYSTDAGRNRDIIWNAGNVVGDLGFPVIPGFEDLVPPGASIS